LHDAARLEKRLGPWRSTWRWLGL